MIIFSHDHNLCFTTYFNTAAFISLWVSPIGQLFDIILYSIKAICYKYVPEAGLDSKDVDILSLVYSSVLIYQNRDFWNMTFISIFGI